MEPVMTQQNPPPRAAVSVVVPVYGPGPHLERAIRALRNQSPPVGDIVISHSGEGDPTARFAGMAGVTVLHSPERLYAGAARNRGLAHVKTEWVAFVDEDIIVDANWHAALQAAIARGDAECISGSIDYAEPGGYWGMSVWYVEFGSVHPYLARRPIVSGPSANIVIQRRLFESVGGFPEDWPRCQDTVAQMRLREAGARIAFEPSLIGFHMNVPGLKRMLRHMYVSGGYGAKARREHPKWPGGMAVRVPPLSLGLWLARIVQTYDRAITARNAPLFSLVKHTPGILLGLLAWNAGFTREAFRHAQRQAPNQAYI